VSQLHAREKKKPIVVLFFVKQIVSYGIHGAQTKVIYSGFG